MVDVERFVAGMDCLTRAEELLGAGGAGFPPTARTLADLRGRLDEARALIDQATVLFESRDAVRRQRHTNSR